jgi:hypothetical protein
MSVLSLDRIMKSGAWLMKYGSTGARKVKGSFVDAILAVVPCMERSDAADGASAPTAVSDSPPSAQPVSSRTATRNVSGLNTGLASIMTSFIPE